MLKRTPDPLEVPTSWDVQCVRKKPGMYIGGTDERALHHCISELLDNSISEFLAGFASRIDVTVHLDGSLSVLDDGRGISIDQMPDGLPAIESLLTRLPTIYKPKERPDFDFSPVSGVGAKCVNAVSERMDVEVIRERCRYRIAFERGKTIEPLACVGPAEGTGTSIRFRRLLKNIRAGFPISASFGGF